MDIVYFLVPASLFLALIALVGFFWSVFAGQLDDLDTPPRRILFDDDELSPGSDDKKQE